MALTVDRITRRMLGLIVDGTWPAGARIPPERELAATFETSRPSVRSAVARLVEWRMLVTRQGSGATVLARHLWKADVLALVIAELLEANDYAAVVPLAIDALEMRHELVRGLLVRASGRVKPGDLDSARDAALRAWAARDDLLRFSQIEVEVVPRVLLAAGMSASVWLVNSLVGPYLAVIEQVAAEAPVPASYLDLMLPLLDAIEAGDGEKVGTQFDGLVADLGMNTVAALPEELRLELAKAMYD